jgi:protein TonB
MEKQHLLKADYLDILYDNRNKTYGGYELRRNYQRRATRATYLVLLMAGIVSSIPVIADTFSGRPTDRTTSCPIGKVTTISDVPRSKPIPVKPVVKTVEAAKIAATVAIRPLKVVDNDRVDDSAPRPVDSLGNRMAGLNNNAGSTDGLVADNGQQDGVGATLPQEPGTIDPPPPPGPVRLVSQMPEFNGDVADYLDKHLSYPEQARSANEEGRAVVAFVVNEDGAVSNPQIAQSAGSRSLDAEAIRVVGSMPKWKPGKNQGVAVKVFFNLPITFKLD